MTKKLQEIKHFCEIKSFDSDGLGGKEITTSQNK